MGNDIGDLHCCTSSSAVTRKLATRNGRTQKEAMTCVRLSTRRKVGAGREQVPRARKGLSARGGLCPPHPRPPGASREGLPISAPTSCPLTAPTIPITQPAAAPGLWHLSLQASSTLQCRVLPQRPAPFSSQHPRRAQRESGHTAVLGDLH